MKDILKMEMSPQRTATQQNDGKLTKVSDCVVHIPVEIIDQQTKYTFSVQRFLGQGSYAKCFEVKNTTTGKNYACKFLSKDNLYQERLRQCVRNEIDIHSHIAHENIAQYFLEFSDNHNLYMLMELCPMKSLKELQQVRGTITEIECRFFIHAILNAVRYLHQLKIVHRDLKLSNVFLSHNLNVKIGDFGLATRISKPNGALYSTCGTANYFSPEMLNKEGYAYEVDIWCVGVIMYFLLAGEAPFRGTTIAELFEKIKTCQYRIPTGLSDDATLMIGEILQENQFTRPTADQCLQLEFIHGNIIPKALPVYCLLREPRLEDIAFDEDESFMNFLDPGDRIRLDFKSCFGASRDRYLNDITILWQQLNNVINNKKNRFFEPNKIDDDQNAQQLKLWIKKWMFDRKSCSAFAYQLTDNSFGIFFDDKTKLSKCPVSDQIEYVDVLDKSAPLTTATRASIANFPTKMKLFAQFETSMQTMLRDSDHTNGRISHQSQRPTVQSWFTTAESIVMYLTNGIVQINFLDHFKLILDPRDGTVTTITPNEMPNTMPFTLIDALPSNIYTRLKYALAKVKYLLDKLKKSKGVGRVTQNSNSDENSMM